MLKTSFGLALAGLAACASGAHAMDCKAARSEVDKGICASPPAIAADDAMAAAYKAVREKLAPAQREMLLVSQRGWIQRRGAGCEAGKPGFAQCLINETDARRAWFESRPEGGPGLNSPMEPALVVRPGHKGAYEVDVELTRFVAPQSAGEKAFNAAVARLMADIPKDAKDIDKDMTYAHDRWMRVTYVSPRLISARVEGYDFEGGAHGNPSFSGLNIDVATGRKLAFNDAFDKAAREKLDAACLAQILPEKKNRGGETPVGDELKDLRKNLDEGLADLSGWNFTAHGATIMFGPYNLGSYAEGSYACDFPLAKLKELAKKGFPLPE